MTQVSLSDRIYYKRRSAVRRTSQNLFERRH
nr:MAG TPA: hypothetical protein [Caudoviricetes sp.]DAZ59249.1 MAG TPA: hypothetical protein [Caudoviricetes sp.]